jgi:hypothetical protein
MDEMKNVDILKEKYRALRLEPSQLFHPSSSGNELSESDDGLAVQSDKLLSLFKVQSKGKPPTRRKVPIVEKEAKKSQAKKKAQAKKKPPCDNNTKYNKRKKKKKASSHILCPFFLKT